MPKNIFGLDETEILSGIQRWVEIESPTTKPEAVNRLVDLVESDLISIGMSVERFPGGDQAADRLKAVTPWGADSDGILVIGHLDTVHPIGTLDNDLPFRIDGNRAFGPGIADMKGGAYLAFNALRYILSHGESTPLPVTIIYNTDEETGSHTSRELIEDTARRSKHVLVCEPGRNGGCVVTARKGSGNFTVRVEGRAAHAGARHSDGRSALREMAHQIIRLEEMTDYDRGTTVNVGVAEGGTRRNVIPAEATAEVDVRVADSDAAGRIKEAVLGLEPKTPDTKVVVTGDIRHPPYEKNNGIDLLYRHAKSVAEELGFDLPETATGGCSDGNFTAALGVPTLDGLGAEGNQVHTLNEHIFIDKLVQRQTLLIRLLQTLE